MDLNITARKAIVCASSRGLGRACAIALAAEGCEVFINGRDPCQLKPGGPWKYVDSTGVEVVQVVADLNSGAGRTALLAACPAPDILVTNNGGPPPGRYQDWDINTWQQALEAQYAQRHYA